MNEENCFDNYCQLPDMMRLELERRNDYQP